MKIFDDVDRVETDPKLYNEPMFRFLNRSALPEAARIRETMESWFLRFPEDGRSDVRSRLRAHDDVPHAGAFLELLIHELFVRLGCNVSLHPETPSGGKRRPDFLVTAPDGSHLYVEATLATGDTRETLAARARLHELFDTLDRMQTAELALHLSISGTATEPISGKAFKAWLKPRLEAQNVDELRASFEQGNPPRWTWEQAGIQFEVTPIPRRSQNAQQGGRMRAIGSRMSLSYSPAEDAIREALLEKASAYGDLEAPYVIAVNAIGVTGAHMHADRLEVASALFGTETFPVNMKPDGSPSGLSFQRKPNGAWVDWKAANNARHVGVSGMLLFHNLDSWSASRAPVRLYHHPWATRPAPEILSELPSARLLEAARRFHPAFFPEDALADTAGAELGALLGLPPAWPEVDS